MGRAHRHAILALAILLACCRFDFALDPSLDINQYAHRAWRTSEGFSKGPITSIAQTPDGYLWLGTKAGLLRFDGVRNVPWQPPGDQRLPAGRIRHLLVTRDGTLWIGTDGGLGSLKNGQLTHYPELAGHIIFALLEDRDGTVWAGGTGVPNGILCGIHNGSVHCYGDDGSFGQGVFALHEDGKGNLWARVAGGRWKWKPGPPKFYSLPGEPPSTQALSEDADGTLLVGWNGGIYRFVDGKTETYSPSGISRQFMSRTLRDRNGGLWIGTHESGLLHLHQGRTDVFSTSDGLSGEVILGILEDREGNIWVGTNGGLDRFRDSAAVTFNVKQGLSNTVVVTALADKDGSVWLPTIGGLNRWDHGQIMIPPTGTAKRDGKLNGNNPTSLFQDDRGRIWVSTFREFGYLEDGRFTTIKGIPEGNKPSIAQDTAGNVWVIDSYVGLFQISPQNEVREIPWADLGHRDDASVLAADRRQGGLWIGFSQGGIAYFSDGQVRATYTTTDGLGAGRVRDLQFGDDGALWVSTERGLSQLKNNRIATMTSKNGLPCDAVQWAMEEDDRSLWLSMACGLVRIARSELDASVADPNRTIQATVFDSSDGVRSTLLIGVFHPQVARTPDGRLWFVTGDGVSVIDTLHLHRNELPPPVHVEQIIADRKTYDASSDANGRLRLPPLIRDLEIDYTALSLTAPEKVRFRVKLEGWDRDWKDAGNERKAFYSNLPPRNYRFRVIACNNSGVWNEAGDTLDFSIDPAYWQTNWFRVSCVAALAILLWMIYKLRVRSIQLHSNQLALINSKLETQIAENADLYTDLQRSEAFLAQGQSISQTGSFGWNVSSGEISWSERTYRIFQYERTVKPTLEFVFQRIHPDDRDLTRQTIDHACNQRKDFDREHRLLMPDGSVKHIHVLAHALEPSSGDLEFVGAVTDVTAAKQASAELEKAFEEIKGLKDRLQNENVALREEIDRASMFEEIVGISPALQAVLSLISKVAPGDSSVLITGETGTGKELVARAIHKHSRRASQAFVSVNCAAIPRDLIASELFGHEKGAYTGATQRRIGRFELAEGGTIFLDEVGELPLETQIALLRVLQEHEFERVGGTVTFPTNVRLIAATNRDLDASMAAGAFRKDLYYRLNVFPIEMPALRERGEDIQLLVEYFIGRFARKAGKSFEAGSKKSLDLLRSYPWPGNIRELQNVIERSVIVCDSDNFSIDERWLSQRPSESGRKQQFEYSKKLVAQEKELIESVLRETKGRVFGPSGAAVKLGMPGTTLDSKIKSLKIDKNRFKIS